MGRVDGDDISTHLCASMHMHDFGRFGLIVGVVLCLTMGMVLTVVFAWFKIGSGG